MAQQRVRPVLQRRVEHGVGVAVAAQEIGQAHQVGRAGGRHEHRAARPRLDQAHPAQDQRPHQPLAQVRLGDHHGAQAIGRDQQRLDLADRVPVHEGGEAGELADLGEEPARPLLDDARIMAQPVPPRDPHPAREDHEQARIRLARLEQERAVRITSHRPEPAQALDLRGCQHGIGLVLTVLQGRVLAQVSVAPRFVRHVLRPRDQPGRGSNVPGRESSRTCRGPSRARNGVLGRAVARQSVPS